MTNPTDVTDEYWVWTDAPPARTETAGRGGKWLIFSHPEQHDEAWALVRDATEDGTLGVQAKAATAKGNPLAKGSKTLLICVYTGDFEDRDDVKRVLARLRELGFGDRIYYKTNEDTRNRVYGKGASLYTAQAGSCEFTARSSG